ncbi:MAG: HipA domain-containing protein [Pseudomonadota bacterium]|nr:HipA domain-containing protein [Pseudomonadota bacterium]MDP1902895.1 HipA domain-containing protein [Pseudomonadota bacterium]MDP2350945.1 HipA domain-containing protein [Pseudomonadota bacterium]
MDRYGVIWTRATGTPVKIADMTLTPRELRITKTQAATDGNVPGVSLLHDVSRIPQIEYLRTEHHQLPPQLAALLPPNDVHNPQRRILAALLERIVNVRGMPLLEKDWHMLMFAGRNGAGHLDVFENDEAAGRHYQGNAIAQTKPLSGSSLWFAFSRFVADTADEEEQEYVLETVGPTPGVSGFMPKLAVPIPITEEGRWNGGLFGANAVPAIVKLERDSYPGLLALEELSYHYHREAGFPVPKTWLKTLEHHGEAVTLLAVERFDRKGNVPVPLESFFSLLKTGSPTKYFSNTDGAMEDAAKVCTVLNLPAAMRDDWYRRFVMSFLTGNGDLHLENMAILGGAGACGLSPVFDPAPMRAYRGGRNSHDLLSALPFTGIGGDERDGYLPFSASGETPTNLGKLLVDFGKSIGIDPRRSRGYIADLLVKTEGFREEALAMLESLPASRKRFRAPDVDGFAKTLAEVRQAIAATFAKTRGRGEGR